MSTTAVRQTFSDARCLRELEWVGVRSFLLNESGKNSKDVENVLELDPEDIRIAVTYGVFLKGYLAGIAMVPKVQRTPWLHLDRLYVSPKERRFGLARYMLDQLKIRSVRALVRNHAATRLYEACGFRPIARQLEPGVIDLRR